MDRQMDRQIDGYNKPDGEYKPEEYCQPGEDRQIRQIDRQIDEEYCQPEEGRQIDGQVGRQIDR